MSKLPFDRGLAHYDEPPPERLEGPAHLEELRAHDRFRFANALDAWIGVTDGVVTSWGQGGGGMIGATTLAVAGKETTFAAVPYADILGEPVVTATSVRFTQTAGGRTGVPTPRRVNRPPFVQLAAPTAWSTVELTLWADGRSSCRIAGASPFPRHWLYDDSGALVAKSGTIEYRRWYRRSFGTATPWGNVDEEVVTGQVESDLERVLSRQIMSGGTKVMKLKAGQRLTRQGDEDGEIYLLLDGVVTVAVDDDVVAELGPGAVLGERAAIEGGRRTSTVTARTVCRVAVTSPATLAGDARAMLAEEHRREETRPG